jgi:hypothetical protein
MITALVLNGCTVAWYELKPVAMTGSMQKQCPKAVDVVLNSVFTTNTFGQEEREQQQLTEMRERYMQTATRVLAAHDCRAEAGGDGTLRIQVEEEQQLSALPQEWLTGLSVGLIPSWGTRPSELRFTFSYKDRLWVYVVDEKRINHIVMFPVFWLSFVLIDEQREFRDALEDFLSGP